MNFRDSPMFQRDFKKLSKRFRTLDNDLTNFKKILSEEPLGIGKHFNVITKENSVYVVKARFFCSSLKKRDLRIIYAYIESCAIIEFVGIEFLEIYFKGEKENEDYDRIKGYIKSIS